MLNDGNKMYLFGHPADTQRIRGATMPTPSSATSNESFPKEDFFFRRALDDSLPVYVLEQPDGPSSFDETESSTKRSRSLHCCWSSSIASTWIKHEKDDGPDTTDANANVGEGSREYELVASPLRNKERVNKDRSHGRFEIEKAASPSQRTTKKGKNMPHSSSSTSNKKEENGKEHSRTTENVVVGGVARIARQRVAMLDAHQWHCFLEHFARATYCYPAYPRAKGWMSSLLRTFKTFRKLGLETEYQRRVMELLLADQKQRKRRGKNTGTSPPEKPKGSSRVLVSEKSSKEKKTLRRRKSLQNAFPPPPKQVNASVQHTSSPPPKQLNASVQHASSPPKRVNVSGEMHNLLFIVYGWAG